MKNMVNANVINNIIKFVDPRLFEFPSIDIYTYTEGYNKFIILYTYNKKHIAVIITDRYVIIENNNGESMLMYEGDEDSDVPIKIRLFNTIIEMIKFIYNN